MSVQRVCQILTTAFHISQNIDTKLASLIILSTILKKDKEKNEI